jgi:hypothetical protein
LFYARREFYRLIAGEDAPEAQAQAQAEEEGEEP